MDINDKKEVTGSRGNARSGRGLTSHVTALAPHLQERARSSYFLFSIICLYTFLSLSRISHFHAPSAPRWSHSFSCILSLIFVIFDNIKEEWERGLKGLYLFPFICLFSDLASLQARLRSLVEKEFTLRPYLLHGEEVATATQAPPCLAEIRRGVPIIFYGSQGGIAPQETHQPRTRGRLASTLSPSGEGVSMSLALFTQKGPFYLSEIIVAQTHSLSRKTGVKAIYFRAGGEDIPLPSVMEVQSAFGMAPNERDFLSTFEVKAIRLERTNALISQAIIIEGLRGCISGTRLARSFFSMEGNPDSKVGGWQPLLRMKGEAHDLGDEQIDLNNEVRVDPCKIYAHYNLSPKGEGGIPLSDEERAQEAAAMVGALVLSAVADCPRYGVDRATPVYNISCGPVPTVGTKLTKFEIEVADPEVAIAIMMKSRRIEPHFYSSTPITGYSVTVAEESLRDAIAVLVTAKIEIVDAGKMDSLGVIISSKPCAKQMRDLLSAKVRFSTSSYHRGQQSSPRYNLEANAGEARTVHVGAGKAAVKIADADAVKSVDADKNVDADQRAEIAFTSSENTHLIGDTFPCQEPKAPIKRISFFVPLSSSHTFFSLAPEWSRQRTDVHQ